MMIREYLNHDVVLTLKQAPKSKIQTEDELGSVVVRPL